MPAPTPDLATYTLGIVGLVMAMMAGFFALARAVLRKDQKGLADEVRRIARNEFHVRHMAHYAGESLYGMYAVVDQQMGLLSRLAAGADVSPEYMATMRVERIRLHTDLDRSLNALVAFSDPREESGPEHRLRRASAFHQLAEESGGADELEALVKLSAHTDNKEKELRAAIDRLRRRLREQRDAAAIAAATTPPEATDDLATSDHQE